MIYKPRTISQLLSSQANYINRSYGQMFYYTDLGQIWYDTQDNNRILATDIIILQFERQRTNYVPLSYVDFPTESNVENITTFLSQYNIVYVIETNCLYKYQNNVWTTLYGIYGSTTVAQTYYPNGTLQTVNADDVSTNGILNDGSVVIRDNNKMICALLRSDGYTTNILGLIGGCINIDPSGNVTGDGCLQLNSNPGVEAQGNANLNSNLVVFGNISVTNPSNWEKQYRLLTENVEITTNTTIKKGSLIKAGSTLGENTYENDTILIEDITVTSGVINQLSKIYKDSVINNYTLQPPFLFDIDTSDIYVLPNTTSINSENITVLEENTLVISNNSPLLNNGDCCYILTENIDLTKLTKVKFNDKEYNIDYIAENGVQSTARLCYYAINNIIKVLP